MREARNLFVALAAGLVSAIVILGSMMLMMAEGGFHLVRSVSATPGLRLTAGASVQPAESVARQAETDMLSASATDSCPPKNDQWQKYTLQIGDTWDELAQKFNISIEELETENCDPGEILIAGYDINLPVSPYTLTPSPTPSPSATLTPSPTFTPTSNPPTNPPADRSSGCTPIRPGGWIAYVVRPGDNLFRIAYTRYINYTELIRVNCLTSEYVYTGQHLYVPAIATRTPDLPAPTAIQPTDDPPLPVPVITFEANSESAPVETLISPPVVPLTGVPVQTSMALPIAILAGMEIRLSRSPLSDIKEAGLPWSL